MNRRKLTLIALLALFVLMVAVSCVRLDWLSKTPPPFTGRFFFQDGFENATTFDDLFPRDFSRWHGFQRESAAKPTPNRVELTSEIVHSGTNALKLVAEPYDGHTASKADIQLERLPFTKGSHVWFSGWFHLKSGGDVALIFLWDLEASDKAQSPGRRLYLQSGGWLASDLGKWWSGKTFRQTKGKEAPFPKDQWVRLKVHLLLSEHDDGLMEVWQNGTKVLDARGQTLPTAKSAYDRLQIGLTANGNRQHANTLYVDDIVLSSEPIE
ncbi:MAG: heparin lyase I family protein [Limisphaerales bacterium]